MSATRPSHVGCVSFETRACPRLFPETEYPREPYTPERVIVQLIFFKRCAPKAGDRELARVIHYLTGHQLSSVCANNRGLCGSVARFPIREVHWAPSRRACLPWPEKSSRSD